MMTLTALLVVPGAIVGAAAQLPLRLALGTSIPVSFGIAAIAGYVYGRVGVPWSLGGYVVATAATAAVVGVVGLLITATPRRRTGDAVAGAAEPVGSADSAGFAEPPGSSAPAGWTAGPGGARGGGCCRARRS